MNAFAGARAQKIADEAEAFDADPANAGKLFIPTSIFPSNALTPNNTLAQDYESVEEAFPAVDPRLTPCGDLIMVMMRVPKLRSGAIQLLSEDRRTERDNTQVARVVAIGPTAFHWQKDLTPWPEGPWCKVGDFVRVPKYSGDRLARSYDRTQVEITPSGARRETVVRDEVHFVQYKHNQILGVYPDADAALSERAFF